MTSRRNVISLARYRRDRERRCELARIRERASEVYGSEVVASWPVCPACQLPMHPAAVANPDGVPFDTHPGCPDVSTNFERKSA